ncbi:hypothetical protein [Bradyrhizobium sp. AUGA SZCCT0431]|uniref:hypothetical protein n=1 Tax=Bradyrhizobium sp. AUGA SZCCT0431 TaxID=2807674 RepID=UPI001BAAD29D|nr:hypothetical protein [Bradyrhizobium sp. AUGA SZCCT0431]MBR1144262.1 hypothetical protein [Bradyrhizobium sp. AUGA SZCCT0431]
MLFGNVSNFDQRVGVATRHDAIVTPHRKIRQMTWARELMENNSVETTRYTMAELYELRRLLIRHSRSMPPGPARNEHRQIAASMRSLACDKKWLAAHTVDGHK